MKRSATSMASLSPIRHQRPAASRPRRRGVALLVVLLLIAMTLGLSYAAMRNQSTELKIHRNSDRQGSARQAAVTGLTMAIKKMHTTEWNGVGTTLAGSLGSYESFQVAYTLGDPSLSAGDSDYEELPYRVTLLSTGYAADPDTPASIATHEIRAVVRLVPRNLGAQPSDWSRMQRYTVYQSRTDAFEIDIPCRLEGPVRIQDKLKIALHYPNDDSAWWRYLGDLNAMRQDGLPDYRPFNGPVYLPFYRQDWKFLYALSNKLSVTVIDSFVREAAADWTKPTSLTSYQIYAGGPVYTIPWVGGTLTNTSLGPDPQTNPLGIYYRDGNIDLLENVTIGGSLLCKDEIRILGTNVHFQPVELPALHDSGSDAVRLPAASCQKFIVKSAAGGSLTGFLAVFDEFRIDKSPETVEFAITGRVVARKFFIKERQPWETLNWRDLYKAFDEELHDDPGSTSPYFPVWMGQRGRDPQPRLTIQPDSVPVTYDWHNWYDPVYEPHPDDDALRWELLEWTENP